MVQINFRISITPRNAVREFEKDGRKFFGKLSDTVLRNMPVIIKDEMRKQAPQRTSRLWTGIKVVRTRKSGGTFDRRASITVSSTVPYTGLVIGGARPSKGDGTPGSGQFFGPATDSVNHLGSGRNRDFKATQGFRGGKPFRARFGVWPGFPGNDFVTRAFPKAKSRVERIYQTSAIKLVSQTHRRWIK